MAAMLDEGFGAGQAGLLAAHLGVPPGSCPRAEEACAECLSLPIFPEMLDEQVKTVAGAILAWERNG